jgi:cytochrome c oxidase subunit II
MEVNMKQFKAGLLALCTAFVIPALMGSSAPSQTSAKLVRIRMTASKYKFDPDVITVKQGDRVELIITAIDRDHGIAIPALSVKQRLRKGIPTTVSFVANKVGIFPFHCSVFCGLGHRHMKGKLIVKGS